MSFKNVHYGKDRIRRNYSHVQTDVELPNLVEIQTASFAKFQNEGIRDLFKEFSPIRDNNNKYEIYLGGEDGTDYKFKKAKIHVNGESVETDDVDAAIAECKRNQSAYSQELQVTVMIKNTETGVMEKKDMYFGEFPMMTPTGTFVINGQERVVVTQIVRSSGVFFESDVDKSTGETTFSGKIIPTRGSWIELTCAKKNMWKVNIDKSKKISLSGFLRALGVEKISFIKSFFGDYKDYWSSTSGASDEAMRSDKAISDLYADIKKEDMNMAPDLARDYIRKNVFSSRAYDLADVGRFKLNQKLNIFERLEAVGYQNCYLKRPEKDLVDPETGEIIIPCSAHASEKEDKELVQVTDTIVKFFSHQDINGRYDHRNLPAFPLYHELTLANPLLEDVVRYEQLDVLVKDEETKKMHSYSIVGNDQNETARLITCSDILATISYYVCLHNGIGKVDDIDNLGNRRLRLTGELLQIYFRNGLNKMQKHIVDKLSMLNPLNQHQDNQMDSNGKTKSQHAESQFDASGLPKLDNLINCKVLTSSVNEFFSQSTLSQFMDQINPLAELTHKRRLSALGTGGLQRERASAEVRDVHATHYGRICPIETPEGQNIGLINSLATYAQVNQFGFIQTPYIRIGHIQDSAGQDYAFQCQRDFRGDNWVEAEHPVLTADQEAKYYIASGNTGTGIFVFLAQGHSVDLTARLQEQIFSAPLKPCPEENKIITLIKDDNTCFDAKVTEQQEEGYYKSSLITLTGLSLGRSTLIVKAGQLETKVEVVVVADEDNNNFAINSSINPLKPTEKRFGNEYFEFSLVGPMAVVLVDKRVYARHESETTELNALNNGLKEIGYMDVAPKQIVAVSPSCIPFLEHCDAKRILMGSNMQRQAIPLLKTEAAFVATGIEEKAGLNSGVAVVASEDGTVEYADALKIIFRGDSGKVYTYDLLKYQRSNDATCINQRPIVSAGERILKGAVLADGQSMDGGEMSLGRNVTIAIMTWQGYNYEDAVIMSERLVQDDVYTSIHIQKHEVQCRQTKLGNEVITRDIDGVSKDLLNLLDEDGIIRVGTEVHEGDILVGKTTPKGATEPTAEEKLAQMLFSTKSQPVKNSSLVVPHGSGGIVHRIERFKRNDGSGMELPATVTEIVRVYIVQKRKITVGDKMSGRYGNKGVISKILPQEDMPYIAGYYKLDENGQPILENGSKVVNRLGGLDGQGMEVGLPVDIMLNPQGIPSRMNIGQVMEAHLGMAAHMIGQRIEEDYLKRMGKVDISKMQTKNGIHVATPVFDGATVEDVQEIMAEAGMRKDGKVCLIDGRTGKPFDNPINVGVMYMIKLAHMVDDKLHARAEGPYTLITQQPMGGKAQNGGQRFGEMEVWALEAYGAAYTLREMLTVKSDDMIGRNKMYNALVDGKQIPEPGIPEAFRVLVRELQGLGLSVKLVNTDGVDVANKSLVADIASSINERPDKIRMKSHQGNSANKDSANTNESADNSSENMDEESIADISEVFANDEEEAN